MVELKKICFPLEKNEFWAHCEFRIFGLKKDPEYLYPLFDIFSKQTTCELKTSTSTSLHSTMISRWTGG